MLDQLLTDFQPEIDVQTGITFAIASKKHLVAILDFIKNMTQIVEVS